MGDQNGRPKAVRKNSQNLSEKNPEKGRLPILGLLVIISFGNCMGNEFIFVNCLGNFVLKEGSPSTDELQLSSLKLWNSWKKLARRLAFDTADITGFCRDDEKEFMMLLRWRRKEGASATYGVLYQALCDDLDQRRDLAERFFCSK